MKTVTGGGRSWAGVENAPERNRESWSFIIENNKVYPNKRTPIKKDAQSCHKSLGIPTYGIKADTLRPAKAVLNDPPEWGIIL